MTQGVLIDTVLLRLNGGVLNDESSVKRMDIRAYIPAAVNWVMSKAYYTNLNSEGTRDFPSNFFGTFEDLPVLRDKNIPYFVVPKSVMAMASNQGYRYIMDACGNPFAPLQDADMFTINHYGAQMEGSRFYRPLGTNVFLYGIGKLMNKVTAVILVDPTQLSDNDNLPIQAGLEKDCIDVLIEFFTGQRKLPADVKNNKVDINAVTQ